MRLPGSGGAADFISYAKRTILTMRSGEFVEKLLYRTSPGYLDGGDSRDRSGHFPQGTGPTKLISTQGIFEFDPTTKEMYLAKVHPGVSVDKIRKKVPWDLKVSPDLTETERPTDDEINFVRRFAPAESVGKNIAVELAIAKMMKRAQNE
jgi:glutaconate CoA-transferase subunit B